MLLFSVQIQKTARKSGDSRDLFSGWSFHDVVGSECAFTAFLTTGFLCMIMTIIYIPVMINII